MFGCKNDDVYVIKCLLKENPFRYIITGLGAGLLIFGMLIMIAESPLDRIPSEFPPHTMNNSIWEALCTMTTVGFGDIYPKTFLGRFICLCCALYGVAMTPFLIVGVNDLLIMESSESLYYTIIRKLQVRQMLKITASKLLVVINKKQDKTSDSQFRKIRRIKNLITEFRNLRRRYKDIQEPGLMEKLNFNYINER